MEEYNNMTVTRLRALAKEHGLKGYSKKRKAELITFLREIVKYEVAMFEFARIKVAKFKPTRFESYEALLITFFREIIKSEPTNFESRKALVFTFFREIAKFDPKLVALECEVREVLKLS